MIKKNLAILRKIGKKLCFLFKLSSQKNVIFFGYSSFQILLLNNISRKIDYYKNRDIVLYDLNKSSAGKTQFKLACRSSKLNIIYIENIGSIEFIFTILICKYKSIRMIHGNYNSFSFKIISSITNKLLFGLDDGSNTLLMPFRLTTKFNEFYTIFPSIRKNKKLNNLVNIIDIPSFPNLDFTEGTKSKKGDVYICGSNDVEEFIVSYDTYINLLNKLIEYLRLRNYKNIFYYPHRRESQEKLSNINIILNKYNYKLIEPKKSFEDFYFDSNLNSLIVSFASTIERSIKYKYSSKKKINILSVRYFPTDILLSYRLQYSILSSSLAYETPLDNLLLFFKNNLLSYDEFFSEFYKKEFIFIDCNSKLYKTYLKSVINDSLDKWKGHPIYVNAKRECFVLKCIIDLDEFDNSIKLAPELLIGLEK